MSAAAGCELCALEDKPAWQVVAQVPALAVLRVLDAPAFPAFYRVVWQQHVAEFTDLGPADRQHCMAAVALVEGALREALAPRKINLAALGNLVPHLHWHVIGRFDWDSHFPQPIWGAVQRPPDADRLQAVHHALPAVDQLIRGRLAGLTP